MNKKGQVSVSNVPAYVISFVLIGLMVAIGIVLLSKFGNVVKDDTNVINETVANKTAFSNIPVRSVSACTNNVSLRLTETTNYTVNTSSNWVVFKGNTAPYNSFYTCNYTYGKSNSASTALDNTVSAVSPITTDWLPIIVIVAIVGVLLALILGAFSFYRGRQ